MNQLDEWQFNKVTTQLLHTICITKRGNARCSDGNKEYSMLKNFMKTYYLQFLRKFLVISSTQINLFPLGKAMY